ncbi:prephenate dehydrogenase [Corynebacterium maris DSM 45190]|uniref:Prephenate dehydrogenase n=1 Tax=Corynebacterium maris DSM 45190 TaxID=1224163 RepID=S5TG39_9CORY|nr:prephenate dehydrogenase [Corynebacterium maris DSM 45190]
MVALVEGGEGELLCRQRHAFFRLGLELVAQAADGDQLAGAGGLFLDLGAQALDVHVERLGVAHVVGAPDAVDELAAGEHPAGVAHQVLEQVELLERHGHRLPADGDGVALDVHAHAPALEDLVVLDDLFLLAAAAQDRADAGDELAGGVRLGDVVVGAEFQADDLVDLRVTGGDHDHRHVRGLAQLLAHVGAGHAGQHQIQQHDVDLVAVEFLQRGRPVAGEEHLEPLLTQEERQRIGQRFLVLNDQDGCHAVNPFDA